MDHQDEFCTRKGVWFVEWFVRVCAETCMCVRETRCGGWGECRLKCAVAQRFSQVGERRTRVPEDKAGFFPSSAPVAVVLV